MIRRKQLGALPVCPPGQFQAQGRCVTIPNIPQLPARYYFFNSQTGWWCPTSVANAQRQLATFTGKPLGPREQKEVASLQAVVAGTAPRAQNVSPGSGCVRAGVVPGLSGLGRIRPRVLTMRGLGRLGWTLPPPDVLAPPPNIPSNLDIFSLPIQVPAVIPPPPPGYVLSKDAAGRYQAVADPKTQQPGLLDKVTAWLNGKGDVIKDVPNLAIAAGAGGVGLVVLAAMSGGKRR